MSRVNSSSTQPPVVQWLVEANTNNIKAPHCLRLVMRNPWWPMGSLTYAILCPEQTNPPRTPINRSIRHHRHGRSFLACDVTTVNLWRHVNVRYWYCCVIFLGCSCTRKLAQSWSSMVNNNRDYLFPTNRYSRFSVQKRYTNFQEAACFSKFHRACIWPGTVKT